MNSRIEDNRPSSVEVRELWREPAMLRLQPSRKRLWVAYGLLPLLGAIVVLVSPMVHEKFLGARYSIQLGPATPRSVLVLETLHRHELLMARLGSTLIACLWGIAAGFQLNVLFAWGLRPMRVRLYNPNFRREVRMSRLTVHDFLYALVRPHFIPMALSSVCMIILGFAQLSLIPTRYGLFEFNDHIYCIATAALSSATVLCHCGLEDFRTFSIGSEFLRTIRQLPIILLLTAGFALPLVYHQRTVFAELGAPQHVEFAPGGSLFVPFDLQVLIMLLIVIGMLGFLRYLWRRMCIQFEDTEA